MKQGIGTFITGALGTLAIVGLMVLGYYTHPTEHLWQPLLVPLILTLALASLGFIEVRTSKHNLWF